jgi:lysophospholipase L1-like esterase
MLAFALVRRSASIEARTYAWRSSQLPGGVFAWGCWAVSMALLGAACGRGEPSRVSDDAAAPVPAASSARIAPDAAPAAPVAESITKPDAAPVPARYARILHTGDSMVGGGLCRALQPKFEREGAKFYRDVWESGRIFQFADSGRLPNLLKKVEPDLVILTLGANDVWMNEPDLIARSAEKIAKMVTDGGRACWWIGPPIWKTHFRKLVALLKDHVAPCTFFDSADIEMARRSDGIHPTDKGGEVWADAFWAAFRPTSSP